MNIASPGCHGWLRIHLSFALGIRPLGADWSVISPSLAAWHRVSDVGEHCMTTPTKAQQRMKRPHCPLVSFGMPCPHSQEPALQRAMEEYFRGRREMGTHSLSSCFLLLFFSTNEIIFYKMICLAMADVTLTRVYTLHWGHLGQSSG